MSSAVFTALSALGVIPVVEIENAAHAVPLARALQTAGLPAMEVTLRTPCALDAIQAISSEVENFWVGAGTLLTEADILAAVDAGASFGVSPGFDPVVAQTAIDTGLPFIPGTVTPSEILAAVRMGFSRVKFFPAGQYGGVNTIKALSAPLAGTGVTFMPTGGVRLSDLAEYLAVPSIFAVGGTWIATKSLISEQRFSNIEDNARAAIATAHAALGK